MFRCVVSGGITKDEAVVVWVKGASGAGVEYLTSESNFMDFLNIQKFLPGGVLIPMC